MAEVTVKQLAGVVGIPVDKLLQQMKDAGLTHGTEEQTISDDEKQQLLSFLKETHGEAEPEAKRITLKRKSVSRLKVGSGPGKSKTVNVEVRKKRTYVKRSAIAEDEREKAEAEDARLAEETEKLAEEAKVKADDDETKRKAKSAEPVSTTAPVKARTIKSPKPSKDKILKRSSAVSKKAAALTPEEEAAEVERIRLEAEDAENLRRAELEKNFDNFGELKSLGGICHDFDKDSIHRS